MNVPWYINGDFSREFRRSGQSTIWYNTHPSCADSKALSAEQRKGLFENIKTHPHVGYIILEIPPQEISSKMLRKYAEMFAFFPFDF